MLTGSKPMIARALVYCENEFGMIDGKVANGLARHSEKSMRFMMPSKY
jgi:hypothetical protein